MSLIRVRRKFQVYEVTKAVTPITFLETLHSILNMYAPKEETGEEIQIQVISSDSVVELLKPIDRKDIDKEVNAAMEKFSIAHEFQTQLIFSDDCIIEICQGKQAMYICHSDATGIQIHDDGEDLLIISGSSSVGVPQSIIFRKTDIPLLCEWLSEYQVSVDHC